MPRATIQGALGPVPVLKRFFRNDPSRKHVRMFISTAARLYIIIMAITGSVLLDLFGPMLLRSAARKREARPCEARTKAEDITEEGWTDKERKLTAIHKRRATMQLANIEQILHAVADGEEPHVAASRLSRYSSSAESLSPIRRIHSSNAKLRDRIGSTKSLLSMADSVMDEDNYRPLIEVVRRETRASTRRRACSANHLESRVHWDLSREESEEWDLNEEDDEDDDDESRRGLDVYVNGVPEEDPNYLPVRPVENGDTISRDGDLL